MDTAIASRGLQQGPPPPPSPPQTSAQSKAEGIHRRGYQACEPCRQRKVRCDLGGVDNPKPPPCARCARESKECVFAAQRKKTEARTPERNIGPRVGRDPAKLNASGNYTDSSSSYNAGSTSPRSWHPSRASVEPATQTARSTYITSSPNQLRDGRSMQGTIKSAPPVAPAARSRFGTDHLVNPTAMELLSPSIHHPNDALQLLSNAAVGASRDQNQQLSPATTFGTPNSQGSQYQRGESYSSKQNQLSNDTTMGDIGNHLSPDRVDPRLVGIPSLDFDSSEMAGALQLWSNFRFVRHGWFTNKEAMEYINYYYRFLAPMTPIVIPDFRSPTTHFTLLTEEPMLAVTMLTLASRHMPLRGSGALSRAYSIHANLWSYLRGMIERLFWGQEHFAGTVPGFGVSALNALKPRDPAVTAPRLNWPGSLRSYGTIEALLLLTDWHPRALHFPPGNDENLLDNMNPILEPQKSGSSDDIKDGGLQQGKQAFATWLEPAWRSDRMCWMLLGNAMALGFELGLFDKKHRSTAFTSLGANSPALEDCPRAQRLRRLILVYTTQNSGRLGITCPLPLREWKDSLVDTGNSTNNVNGQNKRRKVQEPDDEINLMQGLWMEIASIMSDSNEQIFPSKEHTADLIKDGQYTVMIDKFMPIIGEWRSRFEKTKLPAHMRCILTIEIEYTRLYINSLALQAVVEGWKTLFKEAADNRHDPDSGNAIVPGTELLKVYRDNEKYVLEVADASRTLLRTMLDGFYQDGTLRNAPVKIYFRTLSAAIFLLKTFAFGGKEDDLSSSLSLLKETVTALRSCVVDDVHLSITIADLLESLTGSISSRFVRFAVPNSRANETENETTASDNAQQNQNQMAQLPEHAHRNIEPSTFETAAFMPPVDSVYNQFLQDNAFMASTFPSSISGDTPTHGLPSYDNQNNNNVGAVPDYFAMSLSGFAGASFQDGAGNGGPQFDQGISDELLEAILGGTSGYPSGPGFEGNAGHGGFGYGGSGGSGHAGQGGNHGNNGYMM